MKRKKRTENKAKLLNRKKKKNGRETNHLGKEQRGRSSRWSREQPEGPPGKSHTAAASTGLKRRSFQQDAAKGLRQCYK